MTSNLKCQQCNKDLGDPADWDCFIWENEPMCDDCYGEVD